MKMNPAIPVLALVLGLTVLSFCTPLTTDSWWSDSSNSDITIEVSQSFLVSVSSDDSTVIPEDGTMDYVLNQGTTYEVTVTGACTMNVTGSGYTIDGITLSGNSFSFNDEGSFTITPGLGGAVLSFGQ